MVQQPQRRGPAGLVAAVSFAVVATALAVVMQPASRRGIGLALVAAGLAGGLALSRLLPQARPDRSMMERFNDAAFGVVVVAAALLISLAARPWTALLPGLVLGALLGRLVRGGQAPGRPGDDPGARPA